MIDQLDISIKTAKNILLLSHINPDGDTLGSMCAMKHFIYDNYHKKCDMAVVSKIPQNYLFIPGIEDAKLCSEMDDSRIYDLVINLDVASIERVSNAQILFEKAKKTVNIDHHGTNNQYADINIIDSSAAAVGELLTDIANTLNWKFSKNSAICLYTAIMTDTGCFKFSNTTAKTLLNASQLLSYGVDSSEIYKNCYESNSKDMVLFQAYCIGKSQFTCDDRVAYTLVYKKDLEKFNHNDEDFSDGLTEKLRAIKTTEIAFVLKELSTNVSKLSMRSKFADVSKICASFGGGGHKLASGAVIKANMQNALKLVLSEIEKQKSC